MLSRVVGGMAPLVESLHVDEEPPCGEYEHSETVGCNVGCRALGGCLTSWPPLPGA
jgi:hypothetical protein